MSGNGQLFPPEATPPAGKPDAGKEMQLVGQSRPTKDEMRILLTNGLAEFDRNFPSGSVFPKENSAALVNQALSAMYDRPPAADIEDDESREESLVLPQREITIRRDADIGEWVIKQKNWPQADGEIVINDEHVNVFLDALTDAMGVPSIGRPQKA